MHGPMKLPEQQGLDEETPLLEDYDVNTGKTGLRAPADRGLNYREDPTQRRTGNAPSEELAAVILTCVDDAKALASDRQVQLKQPTHAKALEEAISNVRGAVCLCASNQSGTTLRIQNRRQRSVAFTDFAAFIAAAQIPPPAPTGYHRPCVRP